MLRLMIAERAVSAIRKAEKEVRGLIAQAAEAGEYDSVAQLSGMAKRLAAMAGEAENGAAARSAVVPIAKATSSRGATSTNRRGVTSRDYPKFEKARELLVKIGWSKKERKEYVHKAPKAGVDAVARRVMDLGKDGRMFTTEDLLPVDLNGGRDDLPGYQAYICLAWLRAIGAVEQHGREGYTIPVGDRLLDHVSRAWDNLAVSRR